MRRKALAVFQTHPNQHFAPWWREVHESGSVDLTVHYYSAANADETFDPHFGKSYSFDVDLLSGYPGAVLRPGPLHRPREVPRWFWVNRGVRDVFEHREWDAVLLFGYSVLNNWLVLCEAKRRGTPVLYFSDSNVRTLARSDSPRETAKRVLIHRFFDRVSAFLSPGNSNREFLLAHGVEERAIWRCPYPVDVDRFRSAAREARSRRLEIRRSLGLGPSDFVVAFSGKFIPRKRPLDLVEAVLQTKNPSIKALLIGSGPLEPQIRERGGERTKVTGFLNQSEIAPVLAAADVFVMPSDMDAHPLAVTEALACGLPVAVSHLIGCHGPDDAVRDGVNGFVYECGDVAGLGTILERLSLSPALVAEMSNRAVEISGTQSSGEAARQLLECLGALGQERTPRARGWQDRPRE